MARRYYQIMGAQTGMTFGTVLATCFAGALKHFARDKGFKSWEAYRDYCRIEKVEFDGGFRITLI